MNVEQKLSIDKLNVDEGHPHIVMHLEKMDLEIQRILTIVCPAGLYTLDNKGRMAFEFAGCLECGTCRVAVAHKKGALDWAHPRPSFGVEYRCG